MSAAASTASTKAAGDIKGQVPSPLYRIDRPAEVAAVDVSGGLHNPASRMQRRMRYQLLAVKQGDDPPIQIASLLIDLRKSD
jgi:hypothetical protein